MKIQDRLREARHARFVGRDAERELFRSALEATAPPFQLLYIHGPGGVGKTALLREFELLAAEAEVPTVAVDTREVDPTPATFARAASQCNGATDAAERRVLLLDTLEVAPELSDWLRTSFLPDLPSGVLVVLASRQAPNAGWRGDIGWQAITRTVPLRNLTPQESTALLHAQDVPSEAHAVLIRLTHGHPLALALAAEHYRRSPALPQDLGDAPDVVETLLKRFIEDVPNPAERDALEVAAVVRTVTEDVLAALLPDRAAEAFARLANLTFVDVTQDGLRLHELACDTLTAELRWRRPERYEKIEQRARTYYTRRLLETPSEHAQQRILADYAFLHRHNPIVAPLFAELRSKWQEVHPSATGTLCAEELAVLEAMVAAHEGPDAAEIARHWFERQPGGVQVFRSGAPEPCGFLFCLKLEETTAEERALDPGAEAAWAYLDAHAPLREGEGALLFRFWMDAEAYQHVSPVQSLIFVATVHHYLAVDGPAFTFLPCREPDYWTPVLSFAGLHRLPEADFQVDGHTFGVYGHDWRAEPPALWLERLATRGMPRVSNSSGDEGAEPLLVLTEKVFAEAMRDALRCFTRPHELEESPLLRSRFVARRAGDGDRVEALQAAIEEVAGQFRATPREEPHYLALDATYLDPARTQAEAAEQLDLPFSTYRRYLKRAVDYVTDVLWQEELNA